MATRLEHEHEHEYHRYILYSQYVAGARIWWAISCHKPPRPIAHRLPFQTLCASEVRAMNAGSAGRMDVLLDGVIYL